MLEAHEPSEAAAPSEESVLLNIQPLVEPSIVGEVTLLSMQTCKIGTATAYCLQFQLRSEQWMVTRRYSDFLRCHVRLLESFQRDELPPLPPKEPVLQKIFAKSTARLGWATERAVALQRYLMGLLVDPGVVRNIAFQEFLDVPCALRSSACSLAQEAERDTEELISGIRVKLTGQPGIVEVAVRSVSSSTVDSSRRVEINLLRLEIGGEVCHITDLYARLTAEVELPEAGKEVSVRFDLEPGSLWEASAACATSPDDKPIGVLLRAPTAQDLHALPTSAAVTVAKARLVFAVPPTSEGDRSGGMCLPEDLHALPTSAAVEAANARDISIDRFTSEGDRSGGVCVAEVAVGAESEVEESADATAEGIRGPASTVTSGRVGRLPRGEVKHTVMSYQGSAAAEYVSKVIESQRQTMERAPHQLEGNGGSKRSVPVRYPIIAPTRSASNDVVVPIDFESAAFHRDADELDSSRKEQRMHALQEDEFAAAHWIHAVTGYEAAGAAARGEGSLEEALRSGEALCDLVNAVWPGRIVGILRGQVKPYRRVENITKFLNVCGDLGLVGYSRFAPVDLTEGKNFGRVVRCIFDLDELIPCPPIYEGPRLCHSRNLRSTTPRLSRVDNSVTPLGPAGSTGGTESP